MNILTQPLPSAVLIGGKAVEIRTDYKTCLKAIKALGDARLTEAEKLTVLCTLMYPTPPSDAAAAVTQALKFLNCGAEASAARLTKPVYSFDKDSAYIYTAFKSTFNIDLTTADLHWWEFRSLFADLGKDCFFNTLISLRSRQNSGKLTKDEKEFVRRHADLISLTERQHSAAVEDFVSKIGRRTNGTV